MKKGLPILITTVLGALVCAVIRFFQYVTILDFETGFFTNGSELAGGAVYIAFAVFGAAAVFLAIFGEKRGWTATTASSDGLGAKASLVQGVCWLAAAAILCMGIFGESGFTVVYCALSAAMFALIGFMLLKNTVPPPLSGILNLVPSLLLFIKLTLLFRDDMVIKNRSENLIILLGYICGVLFLSGAARFFTRLEGKHTRVRELITAALTLLFTLAHVAAKLLGMLFGGALTAGMSGIDPTTAALAVISLGWLVTVCCFEQKKELEIISFDDESDRTEEKVEKN